MTDEERRIRKARMLRRKKRRRQLMIRRIIAACIAVLVLILLITVIVFAAKKIHGKITSKGNKPTKIENNIGSDELSEVSAEPEVDPTEVRKGILDDAAYIAAGYDYDGAIAMLKTVDGYEEDAEITDLISKYTSDRDAMVPVDMEHITHIFYHSLVVDPSLGFVGQGADGFKQWMTTVYEFDQITQQMYDNGYVLISLNDMVDRVTDENGKVKVVQKQLYLPEGKKPFVLSLDDISYYHSYDGHGVATKLVVDENGMPTCEYIDKDGNVSYGDYDSIPRLNTFLEAHPDGAYHGARGTVALTGYNGVFGYRTDIAYKTHEKLDAVQKKWLEEHPDFDYEKECEEAKKVADAIKASGWTIGSHTWGHMRVGDSSLERLQADTGKWKAYVEPITGPTDIIIFAHGQDLCGVEDYSYSNDKFAYLKGQGYNIFCNVDSSQYFLQYRDDYMRMGRRNLDGYRLWNDVHGEKNRTSDIIDANTVLDPARTDMPAL